MRLLVINPNTSDDVTSLIHAEAARNAGSGTELDVRTAPHGVEYIETRLESLIAAGAVAEIVSDAMSGGGPLPDAVVVAAFGDPGMPALKELADVPVIGITEAALCAAALHGSRFSIVAISPRIAADRRVVPRLRRRLRIRRPAGLDPQHPGGAERHRQGPAGLRRNPRGAGQARRR